MQSLRFVKLNKVLWIAAGFSNLKISQAEAITANTEITVLVKKR
jgi:hypothetical protein